MKNKELYERSVNILLDAYNEEKLFHGNCYACAVGNLCGGRHEWGYIFQTSATGYQTINKIDSYGDGGYFQEKFKEGLVLVEQTGYSVAELARIEFEFESSISKTKEGSAYYRVCSAKKGQFIGLCAVLDVLRDIHEVEKDSHEESHSRLETIYKKFQSV